MKTFLSLLSVLALVPAALAPGLFHLSFGDAAMAAMTAAIFGLALGDGVQPHRVSRRLV